MKKPATGGYVEVRFRIPVTKVMEAKQALASYGAIAEDPGSIPWEEVYPDFNGSVALRGARKREALTQKALAHLVGISQTHISEWSMARGPSARTWPSGWPRSSRSIIGCSYDHRAARGRRTLTNSLRAIIPQFLFRPAFLQKHVWFWCRQYIHLHGLTLWG